MISEPDLMGETKGPPSKRARPDAPLETPSNPDAGKVSTFRLFGFGFFFVFRLKHYNRHRLLAD